MKECRILIERIKAGDKNAFRTLIEMHQRLVGHIVFRMISNAADRKDLCQDVFLKVYQNLAGFRHESKVSTWIATIAYNTCINYLQKKKVSLFDDHTPEDESLENISGNHMLPDEFVEERDIASRLQNEIGKLDAHFRTILTLYHLDEMSYNEIAQIMDLPEGTVKSYLFRARKRLKKRLMSKYQKEEIWNTSI